ncbi:O-antigen ligase family protein [Proteiniborus sp. MB09-C3]|uniref:O-antigen ligase family protein n=1 Tax=Proteiniborus sp. MB09-C3 TaxID=3050072 RepID=UPI0025550647|nr:O-antigen ligase family protein [Proteiniborus sp. MB09-C3]WIV10449.1 O-antigen ligase family protein [Proteiniborus sp. MB09-C3]
MKLNKIIVYLIFIILILGALLPVASYLLMGILIALLVAFRQEKIIWNHLLHNRILLVMIISTVLSSLFSDLWYISIFFSILYIMKILFCSIISCYLDEEHVDKIIFLLMCLGIIVSAIGIFQYFYFNGDMPKSWVDSNVYDIDFRAYSTFFNPNILAGFLNLTLLVGIVQFESNKNNRNMIIAILCSVLSTSCLLLTYSRNGWLSLCISFVALSIINRKYIKYAVLFPVIFVIFDFLGDTGRLLPRNIVADSSIEYRIKIWIAAIKILKDNLVLGIGPGTIWEQIPLYSNDLKAYISHVHNIYLQRLVDTGIIGLFCFVWFIKYLWSRIREDVFNNLDISIISLGFYVTLLGNGFFDAICFQEQISVYVWTLIGINLAKTKSNRTVNEKHEEIQEKTC